MMTETCFNCDAGTFVPDLVTLVGSRNGEEFNVSVHGLRCDSCGFATVDNSQSGEFTKAVSDAYRAAHGMLTGSEIKSRRLALKMTQEAFAEYLGGVGRISVNRWESGRVQDRAMDELIRLKTDPQAARENLKTLELQVAEDHLASSIRLGDHDAFDLLFSGQPTFTSKPHMKMGKVKLEKTAFWAEEPVAA